MNFQIKYSGSITVDLATVKAIRIEYAEKNGGFLIFDFNDMVQTVTDPLTEEIRLQSFPNSSVKHFFDSLDLLKAYYDEWTDYWNDYKKSL